MSYLVLNYCWFRVTNFTFVCVLSLSFELPWVPSSQIHTNNQLHLHRDPPASLNRTCNVINIPSSLPLVPLSLDKQCINDNFLHVWKSGLGMLLAPSSSCHPAQATLPILTRPFPPLWIPDEWFHSTSDLQYGHTWHTFRSTLAAESLRACQSWLSQDIPTGHAFPSGMNDWGSSCIVMHSSEGLVFNRKEFEGMRTWYYHYAPT